MDALTQELTEAVPVPDHIPPEAVYDFDMRFDPGLLENPHERLREILREAPPVFWTPRNRGTWIAIGFDEVFGLTAAWGTLYGLTTAGELIRIDERTGQGTGIMTFDGVTWWGAASTPGR